MKRTLVLLAVLVSLTSVVFAESLTTWLNRLPGTRLHLRGGLMYFGVDTTYGGIKSGTNVVTTEELVSSGNRVIVADDCTYTGTGLMVGDELVLTSEFMNLVVSTDAITSIATPFISTTSYRLGTVVILTTLGSKDITLSDDDTTSGTLLQFRGVTTRNINTNDYLALRLESDGYWHEMWYSDAEGAIEMAAITCTTINTGQGANEVYDMNQNVQTTDKVTFGTVTGSSATFSGIVEGATVETGQGPTEVYAMNQDVQTTDEPTFATVNTGHGAAELYPSFVADVAALHSSTSTERAYSAVTYAVRTATDSCLAVGGTAADSSNLGSVAASGYATVAATGTVTDQAVKTASAVTFATVDTGQGANELYGMDQGVKTTDSVSHAGVTATSRFALTQYSFANWVPLSVIPSTYSYIVLTSSAAQGTNVDPQIVDGVTGQIIVIEGTTNAVTLYDGLGLNLTGDLALGEDDTVTLMYDGTDWIELAESTNH